MSPTSKDRVRRFARWLAMTTMLLSASAPARAESTQILLLGIHRDGAYSVALTAAAADRLRRVGEHVLVPSGLTKEERACTRPACMSALTSRMLGEVAVSGQIRTSGARAAVEMYVYDNRTQRLETDLGNCNGCTDSALAAQVAAMAGQLFDRNAPRRAPVVNNPASGAATAAATPSAPEQRLAAAIDAVRQFADRAALKAETAAARAEAVTSSVQQLKAASDRSSERIEATAALVQQLKATLDRLDRRGDSSEAMQAAVIEVRDAIARTAAAATQLNARVAALQASSEDLGRRLTLMAEARRSESIAAGPCPPAAEAALDSSAGIAIALPANAAEKGIAALFGALGVAAPSTSTTALFGAAALGTVRYPVGDRP